MKVHFTLAMLAANRRRFFRLLTKLEQQTGGHEFDPLHVMAAIDGEVPDRSRLTRADARRVLRLLA